MTAELLPRPPGLPAFHLGIIQCWSSQSHDLCYELELKTPCSQKEQSLAQPPGLDNGVCVYVHVCSCVKAQVLEAFVSGALCGD